jgi:signal recognition particle subunit SRP54
MFESLSDKLSGIFDKLTRRGALTEADVGEALREVRRALLDADVALDVVRSFTDKVQSRAVGANIVKSISPGQMVIKIVNDVLVETLGENAEPLAIEQRPPVVIMMVGLQGAGKTTTTAKIAKRLKERHKKRVLMASLDVKRPAAQEQLAILGRQIDVDTVPIVPNLTPIRIARVAMETARVEGYDVVLLDTAGRTHIDEPLMQEMADIKSYASPHEILLVADALTGQDAVNLAKNFDARVGLTGIVLTRMDGDGRGGAALSMRHVTGKPIKLIATGEKLDALDEFAPKRIADRILGMGDIVALVEKAAAAIDAEEAERAAQRLAKGKFDLQDLCDQLAMAEKMGGIGGIMGLMPGIAKAKEQLAAANVDEKMLKRMRAIILSMTPKERRNPDILKASRKRRIAAGAGVKVEEINKLLKQHRGMADVMKAMSGKGGGGLMSRAAQMMGMGGMPMPSQEEIAELQKKLGAGPKGGGLPEAPPKELFAPKPGTLPGLGGKSLLGGLNPFGKKK